MLLRMYTRWAERRRFKVEVLEMHDGEEAGIKSATLLIKGHNAYGWLKTESGVHRLVRISPYDSNARRHTSLRQRLGLSGHRRHDRDRRRRNAMCASTPIARPAPAASMSTPPIRRCASPISPTGIVGRLPAGALAAQEPATAWEMLRARLYEAELKKREAAANAEAASKTDIGWGHQIRSYVLQPYQLVKDLRTGVESTSPSDVLDGDLDDFMEASLSQRIEGVAQTEVADLD